MLNQLKANPPDSPNRQAWREFSSAVLSRFNSHTGGSRACIDPRKKRPLRSAPFDPLTASVETQVGTALDVARLGFRQAERAIPITKVSPRQDDSGTKDGSRLLIGWKVQDSKTSPGGPKAGGRRTSRWRM